MKKKYYFTFGQSHCQEDGTPMKDYWVEVIADNYTEARRIFIEQFSSVCMESPDKWSFQYEENEFNKTYFPKGCYAVFGESNKTEKHEDIL